VSPKWQALRITADQVDLYFPPGHPSNIGLLLGEPSGRLVDVDLDCGEATILAPAILPPTGMIHGRESRPKSHYWYICSAPPSSVARYTDACGGTIIELRSTGGQTVVPPSVHPSGEQVVWDAAGAPAQVEIEHLDRRVRLVAATVLLLRVGPTADQPGWPRFVDAVRDDLRAAGHTAEEIQLVISALAEVRS